MTARLQLAARLPLVVDNRVISLSLVHSAAAEVSLGLVDVGAIAVARIGEQARLLQPVFQAELLLEVFEENEREIVTGKLCCKACKECYPIEEGIPNMLPPDLRD